MGLRMKNFNIMGGSLKILIFMVGGGGVPKKPIYRRELSKKGDLTVSRFKGDGGGGSLAKKRGMVFLRRGGCGGGGGLIP